MAYLDDVYSAVVEIDFELRQGVKLSVTLFNNAHVISRKYSLSLVHVRADLVAVYTRRWGCSPSFTASQIRKVW